MDQTGWLSLDNFVSPCEGMEGRREGDSVTLDIRGPSPFAEERQGEGFASSYVLGSAPAAPASGHSLSPREKGRGVRSLRLFQRVSQNVEVLQREAGADGNGGERVIGDVAGDAGDFGEQVVEVTQQRAAAGEDHALVNDVGR